MEVDRSRLSSAERLLWDYGITEPNHIDLEAIANDHGVEVKYRQLGGCEARIVVRGDRAIISVNSASTDGRRRFSLAHELAHWICDRKGGSFSCSIIDIGPQNAQAKSVESQANSYASQLILPTYLVDPWLQNRKINLDTASQLGKEFKASVTAAAIKLVRRATMPACVACHNQTRMTWHQRSATFPPDFYVLSELHHETDAFRVAFGDAAGLTLPKREPAHRWISGKNAFRLEVSTQSIKLRDATVLTLIALSP